jgi:biuret amidohydrolase
LIGDTVTRHEVGEATDAVAGIPAEYGAAMVTNTLSLLATITSTDDLIQTWSQPDEGTL